jgi:hypothetical protein
MLDQAKKLVTAMYIDLSEDEFLNGWKMVNIMIGNNDVEKFCYNRV